MSSVPTVERDERTVAVENASYKWAFTFLCCALIIDMLYRCIFRHEFVWDFLAMLMVAGGICEWYQDRRKARSQSRRARVERVLIICGGAVFGLIALAIMFWFGRW